MSDKINKLILGFIPTNQCNLKCEYCFVSQTNEWERNDIEFKYPVKHIIKALSKKRLGGTCYVNLTAQGETLIYKDIVPLVKGLLEEGHYVEIVTNGTVTKRIEELLSLPEKLLEHLFFKISYHYEEMKKLHLEQRYWDNIRMIKASFCSFTVELMPHDNTVSEIDDICKQCHENIGAVCHATVGRNDKKNSKELLTDMTHTDYAKTWSTLKSDMFNFKMKLFGSKRKEFCYAGKWSLLIDLSTGKTAQCYGRMNTQNIFKDISKPIKFIPVGYSCAQAFCFNGHSHMAWGLIPELEAPYYYNIRNRQCADGSNWVKSGCEQFFKQKISDYNEPYSRVRKILHGVVNPFYLVVCLLYDIPGLKRKSKKFYKIIRGKF